MTLTNTGTEKLWRLEAKLEAAEYLLANLYTQAFLARHVPPVGRQAINDKLRAMLTGQMLPGFTRAWRTTLPLAVQCAIEHDMLLMEEMVERTIQKRGLWVEWADEEG